MSGPLPDSSASFGDPKVHLLRLSLAFVLLNSFVLGILGLLLWASRQSHEMRARESAETMSLMIAGTMNAIFTDTTHALYTLRDEVEEAAEHHDAEEKVIPPILERERRRVPMVNAFRYANAAGDILYGTQVRAEDHISVAERDYFQYHRDHNDPNALILKPIFGYISQQWVILISVRCNNPDGSFRGVLYATFSTEELSRFLPKLDLAPQTIVVLRDENLGMVAHYPANYLLGVPEGGKGYPQALSDAIRAHPDHGMLPLMPGWDGVTRQYFYRRTMPFPGYLVYGVAIDDFLEVWWRELHACEGIAVLFFGLSMFLMRRSWQAWNAQRALLLQLSQEKEHFHIIADYTYDWEYWLGAEGELLFISPSCQTMTGYTEEEFQNFPQLMQSIVYSDDLARFLEHVTHERESHVSGELDFRIVRKDGALRWIARGSRPVFNSEGVYMGRRVSNRDITDRVLISEQLQEMARTDVLTGLPNRRAFVDVATSEFERTRRYGNRSSILMLDLDHFKQVNDTYGHEGGDLALQALGALLARAGRISDSAARWGGEEFVLLLTETPLSAARDVAERIRKAVESLEIQAGPHSFRLSVSVGVAAFSRVDNDWYQALSRADRALYAAKETGRNRVVVDGEQIPAAAHLPAAAHR